MPNPQSHVTLVDHPRDPGYLVARCSAELNTAMATFEAARAEFAELGGYVFHRELLDAFRKWARFQDIRVLDESGENRRHVNPDRLLAAMCASCGQAGSATNPPRFCPACGETWDPISPADLEGNDPVHVTVCGHCGHRQKGGRFPRCSQCGKLYALAVVDGDTPPDPLAAIKATVRAKMATMTRKVQAADPHLLDPVPVGAVLAGAPVPVAPDLPKPDPADTVDDPDTDPVDDLAALRADVPADPGPCVCTPDECLGVFGEDDPRLRSCAACLALDPEDDCLAAEGTPPPAPRTGPVDRGAVRAAAAAVGDHLEAQRQARIAAREAEHRTEAAAQADAKARARKAAEWTERVAARGGSVEDAAGDVDRMLADPDHAAAVLGKARRVLATVGSDRDAEWLAHAYAALGVTPPTDPATPPPPDVERTASPEPPEPPGVTRDDLHDPR